MDSTASGDWSVGATWVGGVAPAATDAVVIKKNHAVKVDNTTCVALSVTLEVGTTGGDVGGQLYPSTTANSKLVVQNGVTCPGSTGGSGAYTTYFNYDMSAASSYVTELVLNNSGATGAGYGLVISGNYQLKSSTRKRHTTITGAIAAGDTTATMADTTGWAVGDRLIFATTSAYDATTYSTTAVSWSGGYITCTVSSTTGLSKGCTVNITGLAPNTLNGDWVIYDVPGGTTFRIAMADPGAISDQVGSARLCPKIDQVTIATLPGSNVVTWTDGSGTGGGVAFAHASGCPVGSLSSNLIVRTGAPGNVGSATVIPGHIVINSAAGAMTVDSYVDGPELRSLGAGSGYGYIFNTSTSNSRAKSFSNIVFYDTRSNCWLMQSALQLTKQNNIFYCTTDYLMYNSSDPNGSVEVTPDEDYVVFRSDVSANAGFYIVYKGQNQLRHKISGCRTPGSISGGMFHNRSKIGMLIQDCDIWSSASGVVNLTDVLLDGCRFGSKVFTGCDNTQNIYTATGTIEALDCEFPASLGRSGASSTLPSTLLTVTNRDADPGVQEIYGSHSNTIPVIQRNTTTINRSTSSVEMTCNATTAITYQFSVLAKAGQTITLLTYVRKSSSPAYGAATLPSVTISGLGITPVVSTMAGGTAADDWELLTTQATNSGASDGNLTVTLTAQSATAGAKAFFSGLPCAPFITRARHYGYIFDETSPTRTVDTLTLAAFATADEYTGLSISWGASLSPLTVSSNHTFQEVFDYHQAKATQNVGSAIGLTAAGVAGSPSIFAAADVTINDGFKLSDSGSYAFTGTTATTGAMTLSADATADKFTRASGSFITNGFAVGSVIVTSGFTNASNNGMFTITALDATNMTVDAALTTESGGGDELILEKTLLSTEFSSGVNYTFGNGTWSQATSVPTFNGGLLNLGAAGSYAFTVAASMVWSMTPTVASTYVAGGCTITGMLDLRNTTAYAITVELPSGTSTTTANNRGGAITVSLPTVYADLSVTGMPIATGASTRLQIINHTAVSATAWQTLTVYVAGALRRRTTGLGSENTAGLYMRCTTGGTSGALEPTWNTTVGGTTTDGTVTWTTYAVLFYDADPVTSSYITTYIDGNQFLAGETVKVRFAEMDAGTSFKRYDITLVAATTGFSTVVDEVADEVYATNGLNGSSYEGTYSPNFALDYIVLDTNTDFSGVSAYAYFCYTLTTSNGMYEFWGGVTALDVGNYRIESDILNLYFDESTGFVKQTDSVRIYRKDGTRPALDPTTGGNGLEINWRVPVSVVSTGGSALTPTESAYLLALPSASSNASSVMSHADMVKLIKRGLNKFVLNPADGTVKVYDNDGTTLLYSGIAYSDAAGTTLYDGTAAVHHTTRLT